MPREDIINLTNEVFEGEFEVSADRLVPEAQLFEDLGLDSLDIVDLIVALQQKFGVSIRDDERVRSIRSLQDIYDFIGAVQGEMAEQDSPS